ncbi:molybdate ABC transporter substrate-binding protein [Marinicellulosiphila megalodicopiae]|uniref:molybdate ABC transporter substrate-binding protein n=1 Tax=Marinicellulosiphila megalodicopiae TaxID=2724896 RepID=UPI003BB1B98A
MRSFIFFTILLFCCQTKLRAESFDVTVAVAANFAEPLKILINDFERVHPKIKVNMVIGSSGKLFAQIQQNAPFDLFLSADQSKPLALIASGHAIKDSLHTYAQGTLVLWSYSETPLNNESLKTFKGKLAIANPKIAPYGEASMEVIHHYENPNIQIIQANNVLGVLQYVKSQSVEMGLVALSSLSQFPLTSLNIWHVDSALYSPILQDMVILNDNPHTRIFWIFLQSEQAKIVKHQFGYKDSQ